MKKSTIKRTFKETGKSEIYELVYQESTWVNKTGLDGKPHREKQEGKWLVVDGSPVDQELDVFISCNDSGALYEHPIFTLEILDKDS